MAEKKKLDMKNVKDKVASLHWQMVRSQDGSIRRSAETGQIAELFSINADLIDALDSDKKDFEEEAKEIVKKKEPVAEPIKDEKPKKPAKKAKAK